MASPDLPLPDLLDQVHACLRRGDLAALPALTAAMHEAEAGARDASAEDLRKIRRQLERNAKSLIAARRGVIAARRRIEEVISVARGLVTYDRNGQRVAESHDNRLAKRF
jgi:plasmid stabilization system protein ParE